DLMDSKIVSILLHDEATQTLNIAATQSLSASYRDKPAVSADKSVSGRALRTREPQRVVDLSQDPGFWIPEVARQEGLVSLLCVPMLVRGQAIGVINSYSQYPRRYTEDDIKTLALVAGQTAIAVENARLHCATAAFQEDLKQRKLMAQAKALLFQKYRMDEVAAHRYLQKQSMNRRVPLREIAEALLFPKGTKTI
ncbi:MAG: GAF domain-containing protein, partial [bacterium]